MVEVEDHIWQRQLFCLTRHIVGNIERRVGSGLVDDLEFRVVPRKREPQRAGASAGALFDEANEIADPVMRSIYRAARNKARA